MFFSPSIYAEYLMIFIILDYFMPNLFPPTIYAECFITYIHVSEWGTNWIRDFAKSIHDSGIYTRNHEVVLQKYSIKSCLFSF